MTERYTREQRRELEQALQRKEELKCPACGAALTSQTVVPPTTVSYVRHRVWLLCTGCRRSVSLDSR